MKAIPLPNNLPIGNYEWSVNLYCDGHMCEPTNPEVFEPIVVKPRDFSVLVALIVSVALILTFFFYEKNKTHKRYARARKRQRLSTEIREGK